MRLRFDSNIQLLMKPVKAHDFVVTSVAFAAHDAGAYAAAPLVVR